jgi:hypothetical protein
VRGDVRHRRCLTSSKCSMARRSIQVPGGCVGMAGGSSGLGHPDLAARPRPSLLNGVSWPRIGGSLRLEEMQNVLRAQCRPQGKKLMVWIREHPTAADGDEARVALFGEDHAAPFTNTDF